MINKIGYRNLSLITICVVLCVFFISFIPIISLIIIGIPLLLLLLFNNKIYTYLLFFIIILNLILNYGFSNVGIRVIGIAIPFNQLLIIIGIFRIFIFKTRPVLKNSKNISLIILFLIFIVRIPIDFINHGAFALRDGTHYLDLMYYLLVISELTIMKRRKVNVNKFINKFINLSFNLFWIYSLTMLLGDTIKNISIKYPGVQKDISIFGYYVGAAIWLIVISFYDSYLLSRKNIKGKNRLFLYLRMITSILLIFYMESRVGIIGISAIIIVFIILNKAFVVKRYLYALISIIGSGILLILCGLEINIGGNVVNLQYIKNFFFSMIGQGELHSMANGFNQRIGWIKKILEDNWTFSNFFFGQGFGIALTDFISDGKSLVREPHNSIISIYARMGIICVGVWLSFILNCFREAINNIRKSNNKNYILIIIFLIICIVDSIVEPFFETTSKALVFYSFMGMFNFLNRKENLES